MLRNCFKNVKKPSCSSIRSSTRMRRAQGLAFTSTGKFYDWTSTLDLRREIHQSIRKLSGIQSRKLLVNAPSTVIHQRHRLVPGGISRVHHLPGNGEVPPRTPLVRHEMCGEVCDGRLVNLFDERGSRPKQDIITGVGSALAKRGKC